MRDGVIVAGPSSSGHHSEDDSAGQWLGFLENRRLFVSLFHRPVRAEPKGFHGNLTTF